MITPVPQEDSVFIFTIEEGVYFVNIGNLIFISDYKVHNIVFMLAKAGNWYFVSLSNKVGSCTPIIYY